MEPFVLRQAEGKPALFYLERWMDQFHAHGLSVGFTSRCGGVSTAPYNELNCALHVGDDSRLVIENRRRVAEAVGFDFSSWTCAEQVHGNRIAIITDRDKGRGRLERDTAVPAADGLVTQEEDIMLVSFYADCVPLYFFDPGQRVVALAHAGWKGTVLEIANAVVRTLIEKFGTNPDHLLAAIGPSIGGCCYEVDEQVADKVLELHRRGRLQSPQEEPLPEGLKERGNGRFLLDLKEINRQIMIKAGINPKHIEISSWCTSCHPQWFFSHRKENGRTGRMASWIGIMKKR